MIEIDGLVVQYGDFTAVDHLSLTIEKGTRFGFLGPNGAGKTTTISCLAGLRIPTSGSVTVNGIDVVKSPEKARVLIGHVPQSLALYPDLSVLENMRIFGGLMGLSGKTLKTRIAWGLDLAQLDARQNAHVKDLSGGMKRRLNLATSLLHEPEIIICDEPTTGVDPQSRNHIFETIQHLQEEGATVIYTTHYMEEVEALCERVAIIDHGKIIADDTLEKLLETDATRSFELELNEATQLETLRKLLQDAGVDLAKLIPSPRTLEEVFLELTGRQLREAT